VAPAGVAIADWHNAAGVEGNFADAAGIEARKVEDFERVARGDATYQVSYAFIPCRASEVAPLDVSLYPVVLDAAPFAKTGFQVFDIVSIEGNGAHDAGGRQGFLAHRKDSGRTETRKAIGRRKNLLEEYRGGIRRRRLRCKPQSRFGDAGRLGCGRVSDLHKRYPGHGGWPGERGAHSLGAGEMRSLNPTLFAPVQHGAKSLHASTS
jgi:hypothetical protein